MQPGQRPMVNNENFVDIVWPLGGIDRSRAMHDTKPLSFPDGAPAFTTIHGVNVRSQGALQQRIRGGSRTGLSRHVPDPCVAGWVIQGMGQLLRTSGGETVQESQSGRVVELVAVCQGNVYTATAGAEEWTLVPVDPALTTPPLVYTGLVRSAPNGQKLYFADGESWCYY